MERKHAHDSTDRPPLTFLLSKWYNFLFAAVFLIYGSVKIILSILDRNYDDITTSIFFLLLGVILISVWLGYREFKMWGWYGLLGVNGLVMLLALFNITQLGNIILLVLSGATIFLMMVPTTKSFVLSQD